MKILFAPSEGKIKDGNELFQENSLYFNKNSRKEVLKKYTTILKTASLEELSKLFGLKKMKIF